MKIIGTLSFALLLTTTACVVGPPVENQRERRVENSLEHGHRDHDRRDGHYDDDYYGRDHRDDDYDDDYNDPMGNYDQNHDRYSRSK